MAGSDECVSRRALKVLADFYGIAIPLSLRARGNALNPGTTFSGDAAPGDPRLAWGNTGTPPDRQSPASASKPPPTQRGKSASRR
ncbi:MAG: hypothetical protein IPL05_06735 [Betaproteobacteria bacterium]|nr:hypothetical protein [Betaproteobacteria bacterium]